MRRPLSASGIGPIRISWEYSYIDLQVLSSVIPATFVARADLADWPVVGPTSAAFSTIYIERSRTTDVGRVVEQMAQVLRSGQSVIVFPEGTTSSGESAQRFHSSLIELAARRDLPVHFATEYRTD